MIWEITFLLASFSALTIAQRTFPEEEYLEDLHDLPVAQAITLMPTLDMNEFHFDKSDIKLLTTECDVDKDCLNKKKSSVNKYRQKMQAIQCVNGLYVLKVLDELDSTMVDMKYNRTRFASLQKSVKEYQFYLSGILTLLNLAQWDAYTWQIEIFAFLSSLAAPVFVNVEPFSEHYENHIVSWRENVLEYVDRCIRYEYLLDKTGAAKTVFHFVESMYKGNGDVKNDVITYPRQFYTVSYLMLRHFRSHDYFVFDWLMFDIDLDTSNFDRQHFIRDWTLDPIGGNKYNALIAQHIHLRAEYVAWLHLRKYHAIHDRLHGVTVPNDKFEKQLIDEWKSLAPYLKRILRTVGFKENIYWSALNIMMVDFTKINKEELSVREEFTRNYFCQSVENLGLGSASDMNRQLQQFEISGDLFFLHETIQSNVTKVARFCDKIESVSNPFKHGFICMLVAAQGNKTFVVRRFEKKQ